MKAALQRVWTIGQASLLLARTAWGIAWGHTCLRPRLMPGGASAHPDKRATAQYLGFCNKVKAFAAENYVPLSQKQLLTC